MIDESRFSVLYCDDNGRPNTPVNVTVGSLLLKEMTHLTDDELLEAVLLDPRYQHALRLTSYKEIPYSDRTVSRFRGLVRSKLWIGFKIGAINVKRVIAAALQPSSVGDYSASDGQNTPSENIQHIFVENLNAMMLAA